jgi:hypothetical protein
MFCHGTLGPHCGRPEPHTGGLDPILGIWFAHVEVLGQTWRPGPYIQGSDTLPWGSKLTVDALGYHFFWTRGGPRAAHVVGSGAVAGPE